MSDKEKIKSLIFNKNLRDKFGITQESLRKLLREYHVKNLGGKEINIYEEFMVPVNSL